MNTSLTNNCITNKPLVNIPSENESTKLIAGAKVQGVLEDSPAYEAGFEPGCVICAVNGKQLTDILLWQWESAEDFIELEYIDTDGDTGVIALQRESTEPWGFVFEGNIFDAVHVCKNACKFCFMRQLPQGLRPSLSLRDDDYRLSFLDGTFVTLTNATKEDVERIIQQNISPLRLSFHALSDSVRLQLMGKNHKRGIEVFELLSKAGIEFCVQIVLVPGENDGVELDKTLKYLYNHPSVKEVGIVPLGYTKHQSVFNHSFVETKSAQQVLTQIETMQKIALNERKKPWVYAADEFYLNAASNLHKNCLDENVSLRNEINENRIETDETYTPIDLDMLVPDAEFYGDFEMYEDGIGIVRTTINQWRSEESQEAIKVFKHTVNLSLSSGSIIYLLTGELAAPVLQELVSQANLEGIFKVVPVANKFFGGNVNVTGLLTGQDIIRAVNRLIPKESDIICVPRIIFNSDEITLDDMNLADMEYKAGHTLCVISCNMPQMIADICKAMQ